MNKFIILKRHMTQNRNMIGIMFDNCKFDNNTVLVNTTKNVPACFENLRKIHLSRRINNFVDLPFKHIWGITFDNIIKNEQDNYYILFTDTAIFPIGINYLCRLQKKNNIHFIMYFGDHIGSVDAKNALKYLKKVKFDLIFTFDQDDAQKYGFIYYPVPYSMLDNNICNSIDYDIYYAGSARDRLSILQNTCKFSSKQNVKLKYRIMNVDKNELLYTDKIIYNEHIPYEQVIDEAKRSNCLIDVPANGQSGLSMRYYEAVCYNKKLLTTNKNIVDMPFYDPRYMKVFEKPEDIDWEWVKERIPIDYHYDGRFSPTNLINRIIELEEEKERQQNVEKETS